MKSRIRKLERKAQFTGCSCRMEYFWYDGKHYYLDGTKEIADHKYQQHIKKLNDCERRGGKHDAPMTILITFGKANPNCQ